MTPIDDAPSMSCSLLLPFEARKKGKTTDEFEEEEYLNWDPAERLGSDVMQLHIFSNLDARSLAQCSLVCKRWKGLSQVDSLWAPLCFQLWQRRAHLPLRLMHAKYPVGAYEVYSISMADSLQKKLLREEMCARIWEIQVKPSCGPYWISLDPSSHGGAPLRRYFHCDGSLTADVNDPIWGGQESRWSFVKGGDGSSHQFVKINYWPVFRVLHLSDGRWQLDNVWASYTTQRSLPFDTNHQTWRKLCKRCHSPRLLTTGPKMLDYIVSPSSSNQSNEQNLENLDNVKLFNPYELLANSDKV